MEFEELRLYLRPIKEFKHSVYTILSTMDDKRYRIIIPTGLKGEDVADKLPTGVIFEVVGAPVDILLDPSMRYFRRESEEELILLKVHEEEIEAIKAICGIYT